MRRYRQKAKTIIRTIYRGRRNNGGGRRGFNLLSGKYILLSILIVLVVSNWSSIRSMLNSWGLMKNA